METISYFIKEHERQWDEGPWSDEPDKVQWRDEGTGLPCLIRRGPMGNLCGYVGVSADHPYFQKDYMDEAVDVSVHGGLTFCNFCDEDESGEGICHLVGDGEDDKVWWLGFDCAHAGDLVPHMQWVDKNITHMASWPDDVYRNIQYVQAEVEDLAKQLAAANG